jgi:hypothetical protein
MWHAWERTGKPTISVGKPEGRPRRRWEDGIRMDFREIDWGMWIGFDWLRIGTGGEVL